MDKKFLELSDDIKNKKKINNFLMIKLSIKGFEIRFKIKIPGSFKMVAICGWKHFVFVIFKIK